MNKTRLLLLTAFIVVMLLPLVSDPNLFGKATIDPADSNSIIASRIDESTVWWNASYHYRQHVNVTDTNSTPRVDVPMDMWFTFDNNTCYVD
ncbi:MAG: hypothetical protein P1Q69_02565 [Candidatus Thorarchaeota archaeon]|nr:hypothetical protein [Candidatus Thorarchaeota archaeon]